MLSAVKIMQKSMILYLMLLRGNYCMLGRIILVSSMFYIMSNGRKIDYVEQCVHLGTTL